MRRAFGYILMGVVLVGFAVAPWCVAASDAGAASGVSTERPLLATPGDPLREWWLYVLSRGEQGSAGVWSSVFGDPAVYGELAAELLIGSVRFAGIEAGDPEAFERRLDPRVLTMREDRALVQYRVPGSVQAEAVAALLYEDGEWRLLHLGIPPGWDGFERLERRAALAARVEAGELLAVNDDWAMLPPDRRATATGVEIEARLIRMNPFDTPLRSPVRVHLVANDGTLLATAAAGFAEAAAVGEEVRLVVHVAGVDPDAVGDVRVEVASSFPVDAEATWYVHDDSRYYWYQHATPSFRVALPSTPYRFYTDSRWGENLLVFYLGPHQPRLEVGIVSKPPGGAEAVRKRDPRRLLPAGDGCGAIRRSGAARA